MESAAGISFIVFGVLAGTLCIQFYRLTRDHFYSWLSASLFGSAAGLTLAFFEDYFPGLDEQLARDWGRMVAAACLLTALAVKVRNSKPEVARFPAFFSLLPLLVIPLFPLIMDTIVIKEWVINIYFGGALLISMMLYALYARFNSDNFIVFGGVLVAILGFAWQWLQEMLVPTAPVWIWQLLLLAGMICIVIGFSRLTGLWPASDPDDTEEAGSI